MTHFDLEVHIEKLVRLLGTLEYVYHSFNIVH